MLKSIFQPLLTWYLATLKTIGYPVIVLLMTMESSVLPIPAEAIIPPAAYLAWVEGLNIFNVHFLGWPAEIGLVAAGT
jgi:membrane protein DedA with SNARE-associated domain